MSQDNTRITTISGELKTVEKKTAKNGNEFLTAALQQPGLEFLTKIRAWEQPLIEKLEQAQLHVDNGEAVELVLSVKETPRSEGGYFRDCLSIITFQGDRLIDNSTPGPTQPVAADNRVVAPPTAQRPVGAPSREDQIMLQNAMGHVAHAYGDWTRMNKGYEPSTFSKYLKDIALGATWVLNNVYKQGGYTPTAHEVQRRGPSDPKDGVVDGEGGGDALFEEDNAPLDGEVEI